MKEMLRGMSSADVKAAGFSRVEPDYKIIDDIAYSLQTSVFGQDEACNQLARAVTRSMAGMSDPRRPEMVGMFLGPTGVGKTEMAKSLAKYLYNDKWEKRFLRIDCTQLQESHSVGRLKGSEPSYIGYGDRNILISPEFLEKGGVILFDEIEKANPAVWKWLLPVMEEGQQKALVPTDGHKGWSAELQTLNFSNTYIIMTANVGAEALHKARAGDVGMGFHLSKDKPDMRKIGENELRKQFKSMPEFLGRIDSTVVFNDLERPSFERIFDKFMEEINDDQRYGQNYLAATKELRDFVIDNAETGLFGGREIRHKINHYILDQASEIKFSGVLVDGQPLVADIEEGRVIFWTSEVPLKEPLRLTSGEKKDAGSYIGNKPDVPSEQDTGEEQIYGVKEFKPGFPRIGMFVPKEPGATLELAVTVRQPGQKDLVQYIENIPLLPGK